MRPCTLSGPFSSADPILGSFSLDSGCWNQVLRPTAQDGDIVGLEPCRALNRKRHSGRFNVWLADGHIEYQRPAQLFEINQDSIARRWNKDNQPHRELTTSTWP